MKRILNIKMYEWCSVSFSELTLYFFSLYLVRVIENEYIYNITHFIHSWITRYPFKFYKRSWKWSNIFFPLSQICPHPSLTQVFQLELQNQKRVKPRRPFKVFSGIICIFQVQLWAISLGLGSTWSLCRK